MNDLNKVLAFDIGTKKISCLAAIKSKEESIIYQEFKECDSNGINTLVGSDPVPPNGGAAFHDTAVWIKPIK